MSVPMPLASGNSRSSASRIAPEPVPRSAMRHEPVRRSIGAQQFQRQLDQGFRIRPRHQRFRGEFERQSPEFLDAQDPRNRLARETAAGEIVKANGLIRREPPVRGGDDAAKIKPEHGADQQPRIEFGRIRSRRMRSVRSGCAARFRRFVRRTIRRIFTRRRLGRRAGPPDARWSARRSARPSASPEITCGNL